MKTQKLITLGIFLMLDANLVFCQIMPPELKYEDTLANILGRHKLGIYNIIKTQTPPLCPENGIRNPIPPQQISPDPLPPNQPHLPEIVDTTISTQSTSSAEKNVFWIHGLNGNTNSLAVAAKVSQGGVENDLTFPARKLRSLRGIASSGSTDAQVQLYDEDQGIWYTSIDLQEYAISNVQSNQRTDKDFIIAHSQGGIVGREWLRKMDKNPGTFQQFAYGIVTLGSPHGGAEILNNCRPNLGRDKVPAFMKEACMSLGGAIVIPKIKSNFITSLIPSSVINGLINNGCDVLANTVIPLVLDNFYKETTKDFYVGAPFLDGYNTQGNHIEGLNEYTSNLPIAQFYGVEEEPILWRFMSSTLDIGEVQKNTPSGGIIFGYTNDDHLVTKVTNLINEFDADAKYYEDQGKKHVKKSHAGIGIIAAGVLFGNVPAIVAGGTVFAISSIAAKNNFEKSNALVGGRNWLINANDYYLTDLVGARITESKWECRVIGKVNCRNQTNPSGSGVPAHVVKMDYKYFSTNLSCNEWVGMPLNYTNYHYSVKGTNHVGNCSGVVEKVLQGWVNNYKYKPNDGVVLAESAMYNVKVDDPKKRMTILMDKCNHEQMKNSEQTKKALLKVYEGKAGDFFKTEIR